MLIPLAEPDDALKKISLSSRNRMPSLNHHHPLQLRPHRHMAILLKPRMIKSFKEFLEWTRMLGGASDKSGRKKRRETDRNLNFITKMFSIKVKYCMIFCTNLFIIHTKVRLGKLFIFMLTTFILREQN
jgi:hypothetical protein